MKVILDAMGGDLAPEAAVLGALEAHREFGTEITLVGRGAEILEVMGKHNIRDLPKAAIRRHSRAAFFIGHFNLLILPGEIGRAHV